jgi:hypothetical protein
MKRPVVVAALIAALLLPGCTNSRSLLPPGEDPNRLVEAIAQKGRGDTPIEPDPAGSFLLADCLKTGVKVSECCLLICGVLAYAIAKGHTDGSSVGDTWHHIWSDN